MADLNRIGGMHGVMKLLLDAGLLHGDCLTVTGKTLAENLDAAAPLAAEPGRSSGRSTDPLKPNGHLVVLYGNLAPEGAVAKMSRHEEAALHRPGARVRQRGGRDGSDPERRDPAPATWWSSATRARRAARACAKCCPSPALIVGKGLGERSRAHHRRPFLRRHHGFVVGHVAPEAQVGGPIALLQNGDSITIDSETQEISFDVTAEELAERKSAWTAPPLKVKSGALAKYARLVSSASKGAVTDLF